MIPLTDQDRLRAALAVARHLHEQHPDTNDIPSGTTLTPVGTDDDVLLLTARPPNGRVEDALVRVACIASARAWR